MARVEGRLEEVSKRLNHLKSELAELRAEIREIRGRFWWIIGILLPMWVTNILAILIR